MSNVSILLETHFQPFMMLSYIVPIAAICVILVIMISELVQKENKGKVKKTLIGVVFIVAIIFLVLAAGDYNSIINPQETTNIVDFPKWYAFVYISLNIIIVGVYYVLIKLLNKQEKE